MISFFIKHKLITLGILIQISFFVSALWTKWYDYFFFGSSIHYCCQGLDFYQIPNAVYSFIKGGGLTGKLPPNITPYSQNYFSNYNVYHPLLTFILGGFFLIFDPNVSFNLWILIKLPVTLTLAFYIYKSFKGNKYLDLAIFVLLANFSSYNEIRISQYQYLFNIFLLLFLIFLVKKKNDFETGILFFLTLIAKPIGLLWAPAFFVKKKLKKFLIGLSLFLISTGIFQIMGIGNYYTDNIISHFLRPIPTNTIDIMSLDALLRYTFGFTLEEMRYVKFLALIGILIISLSKKASIIKIIFLLTVYFLFFYDLVYQYHFSVLGPVLSICLIALPEFQTRISRILILLINMPGVFFILRFLKIGFYHNSFLGPDPTFFGWQIVSFFQILLISLLVIRVLIPDIKNLLKLKNASI